MTYSLAGEDASLFRIHSTTGQISVAPGVSLDFETKASYAATGASIRRGDHSRHRRNHQRNRRPAAARARRTGSCRLVPPT